MRKITVMLLRSRIVTYILVHIGLLTFGSQGLDYTYTHAFIHNTHTHTQPFNGLWSGTTRVGWYQKKHSPTHTHPDHQTSFIIFLHLQRSMASSLFILRTWQSSRTTSLQVLFGLPLGLGPSTSYSIHFFTQSSSSFRSTCPYQRSLFCCNANAMSSIHSLSLNSFGSLSFSLTPHIHLTILISARWSAITFSFLTDQAWLPCNMLLHTQLLYNLPVIIKDMSLLVSNGTSCLNLFQPIQILASTAASASPSTLSMSPR